jgi:hypothetical protein
LLLSELDQNAKRQPLLPKLTIGDWVMPGRGRSSFTKRQKEHTRQQKQRDKAERRIQRKDEPSGTPGVSSELDLDELQRHAAEQAALFQMGDDDSDISSIPRERAPEKTEP